MNTAVLLSGGVDSSVALHRVKSEGTVTAFYLKVWLEDEAGFLGDCPWEEDLLSARAVCERVGVELRVVPLQLEYYDLVVSYVLEELKEGRTPSPDIFCNQRIKFGAFFQAVGADFDRVVTGHYARVQRGEDGQYHLWQAPDSVKDQSYFLSHLNQQQLSRLFFPLGSMHKREVRELAGEFGLPNKDRPDSQGICFLGNISYPDFLQHYLGTRSGEIVEREGGQVLGLHEGFWFYTIGQRKGLGLSGGPWYVVGKDCAENRVYVSHRENIGSAFHDSFTCVRPSWIAGREPAWLSGGSAGGAVRLKLKLRHGPKMISCSLRKAGDASGERLAVRMEEGDRGLAPGQFAVFYENDECLGGAMIESYVGMES